MEQYQHINVVHELRPPDTPALRVCRSITFEGAASDVGSGMLIAILLLNERSSAAKAAKRVIVVSTLTTQVRRAGDLKAGCVIATCCHCQPTDHAQKARVVLPASCTRVAWLSTVALGHDCWYLNHINAGVW